MHRLTEHVAGKVESDGLVVRVVVEEIEFGVKIGIDALIGPILHSWCSETTSISALF